MLKDSLDPTCKAIVLTTKSTIPVEFVSEFLCQFLSH